MGRQLALAHATLHATADGILVVGREDEIVLVNNRFRALWRLGEQPLHGGSFSDLLADLAPQVRHPDDFLLLAEQIADRPQAVARDWVECTDGRVFERYTQAQTLEGVTLGRVWCFRDVSEQRQAEHSLALRNLELLTLNRISELFLQRGSVPDIAQRLARELAEATSYPIVRVERFNRDHQTMECIAGTGPLGDGSVLLPEVGLDQTLSGVVVRTGQALVEPDAASRGDYSQLLLSRSGMRTFVSVPMVLRGQVHGALSVANTVVCHVAPEFVRWLTTLANHVVHVIDRVLGEAALRASEERLRLAMEAADDGLWEWDWSTGTFTWNARGYTMLGYAPDSFTVTEERFLALIHPLDLDTAWTRMRADSLKPDGDFEVQFRMATQDGGWRFILCRGKVMVRAADGRPLRLIGTHVDLTDLRRAEEQIQEQAALLEVAQDAIAAEGINRQIRFWNQGAVRITGWDASEAVGKCLADLLDDGGTGTLERARVTTLEQGQWSGEVRVWAKEGRMLILQTRWSLVRDRQGNASAVLTVSTDVTEQRRLETLYLRAQRMESIGTLASGIAHDLNNVFSPIIMGLEELQLRVTDDVCVPLLSLMKTSALRGATTLKQLLAFARGAEGRRGVLEVRLLLKEIIRLLQQTLPKSIHIELDAPTDCWAVVGDPAQLHQVVMNLSVNARDAMPDGGQLKLAVRNVVLDAAAAARHAKASPGSYVTIEVSDTGCGISAEVLNRIFDPFFTTKAPGQGTGLGLWTVLGIMENHNGFVAVESKVGHGSTFRVFFPALPTSSPRASVEPTLLTPPGGHGEFVMVVDDERGIRETVQQVLSLHGYRCEFAEDAASALRLFTERQSEIRLVLIDVMMPDSDGRDLACALRAQKPNVKIILMTGLLAESSLANASQSGVNAFLAKPFTHLELLSALQDQLGQSD